jgi:hypothetical protein
VEADGLMDSESLEFETRKAEEAGTSQLIGGASSSSWFAKKSIGVLFATGALILALGSVVGVAVVASSSTASDITNSSSSSSGGSDTPATMAPTMTPTMSPTTAAPTTAVTSLYELSAIDINGVSRNLSEFAGMVTLVVNVATF